MTTEREYVKPPRFCTECGTRLDVRDVPNQFNEHTGLPVQVYAPCPSQKCGHYGVPHEYPEPVGFFAKLRDFFRTGQTCTKCGQTHYPVNYA